jgi:hypothetical protein
LGSLGGSSKVRDNPIVISVPWEVLFLAYQGSPVDDDLFWPHLCIDTEEVTCAEFIGTDLAKTRRDAGRLIRLPIKGAKKGLEQRRRFTEGLCDSTLSSALLKALNSPNPFCEFSRVLETVPVEAARWLEEERLKDSETLMGWLSRAGIVPDVLPSQSRKILEFPLKRPQP